MLKFVYPACFYPCENSKKYTVVVPDLPGCVTEGIDFADAIEMAIDAASGWVLDSLEDGEEIPKPTDNLNNIKLEYPNGIINFIVLNMDAYSEKYGNKAIRKNLTIPAWLNTAAEKNDVNFSNVLQNALINELHIRK
ncbi:MAG: type II toxin-antitoxin system HicB family antitoxin [Oscillospiraceae bacterium]